MKLEKISPEKARKTALIMGIIAIVSGLHSLYSPPEEIWSTGRWAWLNNILASIFGKYASSVRDILIGCFFILWARSRNNNKP